MRQVFDGRTLRRGRACACPIPRLLSKCGSFWGEVHRLAKIRVRFSEGRCGCSDVGQTGRADRAGSHQSEQQAHRWNTSHNSWIGRTGGDAFDYGIKREGFITTSNCPEDLRALPLVCWKFSALIANGNLQSNTCNSDSGGPLFIRDSQGGAVINVTAGVTSGGKKDTCQTGDQSYDADVQFYHRWIEKSAKYNPAARSCGTGKAIDLSLDVVGDSDRLTDTTQELSYNLTIAPTTQPTSLCDERRGK